MLIVLLIASFLSFSVANAGHTKSLEERMNELEKQIQWLTRENVDLKSKCQTLGEEVKSLKEQGSPVASYVSGSRRQIPENPVAFTALLTTNPSHVGVGQTVVFDKTLLNEGSHYNVHTGVFRVPAEGIYMFYFVFAEGYTAHRLWMRLVVDGTQQDSGVADTFGDGHDAQGTNLAILHLHPGDSVWVQTFQVPDVRIYGSTGFTTFSGVLLTPL